MVCLKILQAGSVIVANQDEAQRSQMIGEYRRIRKLGGGGFGTVYLAEHIHEHSQVAIKILHVPLSKREDFQEFLNETRAMIRLRHPHIIPLLDVGLSHDDFPFLVMEYASRGTLRDRHPKGSQLPLVTIAEYVEQVASALQYAHDRRIIHRDVKPANMLLRADGTLLLSDFGIAKIVEQSTLMSMQTQIGTPAYAAPEQHKGYPGFASDQYSLAIVVYEWLSGTRPFQGTREWLAFQHVTAPPPSLQNHLPTLHPSIEQVIFKALAKEPEERFATVQEFATALQAAVQQATIPQVDTKRLSLDEPPSRETLVPQPIDIEAMHKAGKTSKRLFPARAPLPARPYSWLSRRSTSRRTMLLGLGLAGLATVGVGLTRLVTSQSMKLPPVSHPTPVTPSPTSVPLPQGTRIYGREAGAGPAVTVAWSPDGKYLACGFWGEHHTVELLESSRDNVLLTYTSHIASVWKAVWSYDGKYIASGSDDQTVRVWDAMSGKDLYVYNYRAGVYAVAWSPKEMRIAAGGTDRKVQVWNAKDGGNLVTYSGHGDNVRTVAWSPDGKRIASAGQDKTVHIWDASSGERLFIYRGHSGSVGGVSWSPGGTLIASCSEDKTVKVWDTTSGNDILTYGQHSASVSSVAWSPDGKWIASASRDMTAHVWDARNGSHTYVYTGHPNVVDSVAWSPDSLRVASSDEFSTIHVWQAV
jgi:WD40 repeat protein